VVAGLVIFAAGAAQAIPAEIGLTGSVQDTRIVTGGSTKLFADVTFNLPTGPSVSPPDVLAAGDSQAWQTDYDSTGQPLGLNTTSVTVSDPNASNNPQSIVLGVDVLAHSHPFLWWDLNLWDLEVDEPTIEPEQFAATGGGETFAAAAPNIVNDPPFATAGLDLDRVSWTGDPEITTDLEEFLNLPFSDDPNVGHSFTIFVDLTNPGTFTKKFFLFFSDEDLPGATSPESNATAFNFVAVVVPEPSTTQLLGFALVGLAAMRRRSAQQRLRL
jgi:hypothetical protein